MEDKKNLEEVQKDFAETRQAFVDDPQMLFVSMTCWRLLNNASKAWTNDSDMNMDPAMVSACLLIRDGDYRAVFSGSLVQLGKQFAMAGKTVSEIEAALEGVPDSVAKPIRSGAFDTYLDDGDYPEDVALAGSLPVIVGRLGLAEELVSDEAQMHQFFASCLDGMWGKNWRGKTLGEILDSEVWRSTVGALYCE